MSKYRQNGFNKSLFNTKPLLLERMLDYALVIVLGIAIAFGLFVYFS